MNYQYLINNLTDSYLNQSPTSNIGKLMTLFINALTTFEAQLTLLKNLTDIYDQSGSLLDDLAQLVNTKRITGMGDAQFTALVLVNEAARFSGGTINELVEIGAIVAGATSESIFQPQTEIDAKVYCTLTGNLQNFQSPVYAGAAIAEVRAAGVAVDFNTNFLTLSKICGIYTCITGVLDNTGLLDNSTFLNPFILFNGYEIKVGTGSTGAPLPTDTNLYAPLLTRACTVTTLPSGEMQFSITLQDADCQNATLNEVGLFNPQGKMILKYTFTGIQKSVGQIWGFIFQSDENND